MSCTSIVLSPEDRAFIRAYQPHGCDQWMFDAWERQKYSGLNIRIWTIFSQDLQGNVLVAY